MLGCAIEEASARHGRLSQELRRVYLNACATLAEVGSENQAVLPQLRRVTVESPRFRPAWALLLQAQSDFVARTALSHDASAERAVLRKYVDGARKVDPAMAEATLAELVLNPGLSITQAVAIAEKAKTQDSDNPYVLTSRAEAMQRVGRLIEAVDDAARAAELDPLSPYTRTSLISVLVNSGHAERARAELARAKQLWPGSKTIEAAENALEFRIGDFEKAIATRSGAPGSPIYLKARREPSDANVADYVSFLRRTQRKSSTVVQGLQTLGELNRVDDFYALVSETGEFDYLAVHAYVLFRPWMTGIRRDPRFMILAKRLGLVDYWQSSGKWPDFCNDPELPYDCRAAATPAR